MALKPDYGLRLKRDGYSSSIKMHFYAAAVYSLTVLSQGQYSTCVDIPYTGQLHAMSLDFGPDHLEAILSRGISETTNVRHAAACPRPFHTSNH